jgi:hypothetical protein
MQKFKKIRLKLLKSLNNKVNRKLLAIFGLAFMFIVASVIFFGQTGSGNVKVAKAGNSCDIVNQAEIVVGGQTTTTSTVID